MSVNVKTGHREKHGLFPCASEPCGKASVRVPTATLVISSNWEGYRARATRDDFLFSVEFYREA
jgi:hypothetical protein